MNSEEIRKELRALFTHMTDAQSTLPTLAIAKAIFGKEGTTKMINPHLYEMEKAGLLVKVTDEKGNNPRWRRRTLADNIYRTYQLRDNNML